MGQSPIKPINGPFPVANFDFRRVYLFLVELARSPDGDTAPLPLLSLLLEGLLHSVVAIIVSYHPKEVSETSDIQWEKTANQPVATVPPSHSSEITQFKISKCKNGTLIMAAASVPQPFWTGPSCWYCLTEWQRGDTWWPSWSQTCRLCTSAKQEINKCLALENRLSPKWISLNFNSYSAMHILFIAIDMSFYM